MKTNEMVRHLARELHIPETELQGHADKLDSAGMLDGDDIARAAVLLIAAATGEGEGGIADRVKVRADMNVAETDIISRLEGGTVRTDRTQDYFGTLPAGAKSFLCKTFGEFIGGVLQSRMDGGEMPRHNRSISISRSRPIGIVEMALEADPANSVGTAIFTDIPKSVFETGKTASIPELIMGMETVVTINGAVVDAMAVLIRADKAAA